MTQRRMTQRLTRWGAPLLLMTLVGCGNQNILDTSVAFSHERCKNITAGARLVSFAEAASLRGSQLLGTPPEALPLASAEAADAPPVLVAVSKGPQPTPGYAFALAGPARLDEGTVRLELDWLTPAPDKPMAQVMTHPCIVVAIEGGDWRRVEITETGGAPVAFAER